MTREKRRENQQWHVRIKNEPLRVKRNVFFSPLHVQKQELQTLSRQQRFFDCKRLQIHHDSKAREVACVLHLFLVIVDHLISHK